MKPMSSELENHCQPPQDRLQSLKAQLADPNALVDLNGFFKLTKTDQGFVDAVAIRDRSLENEVGRWIEERSSFELLMSRYRDYDPELHSEELPQHYPLRILSGIGSVSSGKNIFMFFPDALGLLPVDEKDVFGLEFVDVWNNMFRRSIFECVKRTFVIEDHFKILVPLEMNLDRAIYLSSIFHEIGHRTGPFKVSPSFASGMNLSPFQIDVFGELATDSLLIKNLSEFPEIALFIILQRIFWFGRRGFADNPLSASINADNDAWIGSLLWTRLIDSGVITQTSRGLKFNPSRIAGCFESLLHEIDSLAQSTKGRLNQQELVWQWMSDQVPFMRGRFFLPEGLKAVFETCHDIPEVPHFQPTFSYQHLNELRSQAVAPACGEIA
ncbi:MAG: hypothetical protein EOP05_11035 [Proteobacteria bacterium]|nr:MAG: hypothetical protein EOP05_11035 [Pseudomonadota bacterium]